MSDPRTTYWLGLGANLGNPRAAMGAMLAGLGEAGFPVEAVSSVYDTAPRDLEDQPPFLNAAARVGGEGEPPALLEVVKELERRIGRVEGVRFGPRVIDCDLLLWSGGAWDAPDLTIPHPRLIERRFAMVPLLELDPGLRLPDGASLAEIEAALDRDEQPVTRAEPALNWRGS